MFDTIDTDVVSTNKIFTDAEFLELNGMVHWASLGLINDHGEELYLINPDISYVIDLARNQVDPFVFENVLSDDVLYATPAQSANDILQIRGLVTEFCGERPNFWAHCGAYDTVVLKSSIFGRMIDAPKLWPYVTNEISLVFALAGVDDNDYPRQDSELPKHNSLTDTRHLKRVYNSILADAIAGKYNKSRTIREIMLANPGRRD